MSYYDYEKDMLPGLFDRMLEGTRASPQRQRPAHWGPRFVGRATRRGGSARCGRRCGGASTLAGRG
jgi:hypothetical protein